jgi:hypothetical protein
MVAPVFRNPHLFQQLPLRDYMRQKLPTGGQGCVVEDLDVVVRHFGYKYRLDADGRFMLIEQKHPGSFIETAQVFTFRLMHNTMRAGDPEKKRYVGYYVLNIAFDLDNGEPVFPVLVNKKHSLNESDFLQWLNGDLVLPSMWE